MPPSKPSFHVIAVIPQPSPRLLEYGPIAKENCPIFFLNRPDGIDVCGVPPGAYSRIFSIPGPVYGTYKYWLAYK